MSEIKKVELETAAQKFVDKQEEPPYLYQLPVEEGRKTVDEAQNESAKKLEASIEKIEGIHTPSGTVSVTVYKPFDYDEKLPPLIYAHGGGWVFGNDHTHDRLMRELAVLAKHAVFFVNYSLSPEAKYPIALEEIYAVSKWVSDNADELNVDANRLVVGGDSAGGNMAAATTLLAKAQNTPKIAKQLLLYPVMDANFETQSYQDFAKGYFLHKDGMKWFWDQYTFSNKDREEITASPLRATREQLKGLPAALLITGEADVLRDEGEQYAVKLREAGVDVTAKRFDKIVHDFLMLNVLAETDAKQQATEMIVNWLNS